MALPIKSTAPSASKIAARLPGAYFHDAWAIPAALPELDALGQFLRVARSTPKWIDRMMVLRNQVVGLFGLKNLGRIAGVDPSKQSSDYVPGERVGIFTLIEKTEREVLLGDDDNHLSVIVSVHKDVDSCDGQTVITVTTVVHVKNWIGRLYMVPVAPAHRAIARTMVKAVGNAA
ncbi:DUF2867 domain-containing protein [Duganella fentianensis]|nr:DUF2867 domain-containing protein [Duganella fentianensis]